MRFENVTIRFDGTSPLDFAPEVKQIVSQLRSVIGMMQDKIEAMGIVIGTLQDQIEKVESNVSDMNDRLDDIDSKIEDHDKIEIKVDEIESQLDDVNLVDMNETIERHEEFFNRLRNAIK
jgi:predicted RNase H-like nuclease (RuvC/YqgF family)